MKEFIEKLVSRLEEEIDIIKDEVYRDYEERIIEECAIENVIDIVNELAEEYKLLENIEQLNNGWIPCSERLPEKATTYEVTEEVVVNSKKLYIVEHRIFGTEGEWLLPSNRKIIAWMPLPAPYKEGE